MKNIQEAQNCPRSIKFTNCFVGGGVFIFFPFYFFFSVNIISGHSFYIYEHWGLQTAARGRRETAKQHKACVKILIQELGASSQVSDGMGITFWEGLLQLRRLLPQQKWSLEARKRLVWRDMLGRRRIGYFFSCSWPRHFIFSLCSRLD